MDFNLVNLNYSLSLKKIKKVRFMIDIIAKDNMKIKCKNTHNNNTWKLETDHFKLDVDSSMVQKLLLHDYGCIEAGSFFFFSQMMLNPFMIFLD